METKVPMTKEGHQKLQKELTKLKLEDRHEVIAAIEEARSHGDLSENAEYHAAREKQSFIEGRILELEAALSRAQVIDASKFSGEKVLFGARVEVCDEETGDSAIYQIVGQYEADLEQGKISLTSPLAKALIGKEIGDSVEFVSPRGKRNYEILDVQFS